LPDAVQRDAMRRRAGIILNAGGRNGPGQQRITEEVLRIARDKDGGSAITSSAAIRRESGYLVGAGFGLDRL
jgi:hypothetical protein